MSEATGLATAAYFLGRWQMVRLIDDHVAGAFGEFWGEAEFTAAPAAEGLRDASRDPSSSGAGPGPIDWPPSPRGPASGPGNASGPPDAGPDEVLVCSESGVLRFAGRDFAAGRTTFWGFASDGAIHVAYDDGRPFHSFRLAAPQGLHLCGADRYEVNYSFAAESWTSHWIVAGPRKDYTMTTRYCRIDPR
ncbi:hypothetical protein H0I76_06980 [Limibaculum sp. M0105]|uniref:DUF6314 domain-containing protein n=1 Tax=Thermohalobaculum xanthum TaxID=2753746 RepID=A0A8J7SBH2_9RHOB|nr:DUF6314 family protein [Thermohalobaculum xanthum]MBK0398927.1 hypothetical protein [Thermohalobaculum xanthum]